LFLLGSWERLRAGKMIHLDGLLLGSTVQPRDGTVTQDFGFGMKGILERLAHNTKN
jgi:hypothetical protein